MAVAEEKDDGRDPREVAGLCKAIPKRNLGELLHRRRGMVAEFADAMGVSRETVSRWISGTRRMDDSQVAKASWLLGVHPLYLLDMREDAGLSCPCEEWPGDDFTKERKSMWNAIRMLGELTNDEEGIARYIHGVPKYRGILICDFRQSMGMIIEPVGDEAEFAEDTDEHRYEHMRRSLLGFHGDYRSPWAIVRCMLEITTDTIGFVYTNTVIDGVAQLFDTAAYTAERDRLYLTKGAQGMYSDDAYTMRAARARLTSD